MTTYHAGHAPTDDFGAFDVPDSKCVNCLIPHPADCMNDYCFDGEVWALWLLCVCGFYSELKPDR